MSDDFDKIVQIMPAPAGMVAVYTDNNEELHSPVIAMALLEDGNIVAIDFDPDGLFCAATSAGNFVRLEWKP